MGYRGSKSESLYKNLNNFNPQPIQNSVKEQRVDGSWRFHKRLRCTLTGCESSYQIKIPSKQLNNRSFYRTISTMAKQNLNPWFITGFTDAEGCFSLKIQQNAKLKTNWRVRPVFSITLHVKDLLLLESIKNTLGVGKISKSNKTVIFAVDSIKEISVILNHFDQYPLVTHKLSDYLIFKQCFEIIKRNDHRTEKGLLELISLKSYLNLGLPNNLKIHFPNIIPKDRPEYKFKGIPNPFWVSGFTSGDGSFHIVIRGLNSKPGPFRIGTGVFVRFSIHLHIREVEILKGLATYFKLLTKNSNSTYVNKKVTILKRSASLQLSKLSDIIDIIIPFFNEYPIMGKKSLDFEDFKKVCHIIKTKKHLESPLVFNNILKIKSGMNLNRE